MLTTDNRSNRRRFSGTKPAYIILPIIFAAVIAAVYLIDFSSTENGAKPPPMKSNSTGAASSFDDYEFKKEGELILLSSKNDTIKIIDIEIAVQKEQRTQGMMHRDIFPDDQGMLFIFDKEEMLSFWMRNTILSLDMIFVNTDLQIVTIRRNTDPISDTHYFSDEPALYVVEVAAGFCERYGIVEGDKIYWSRN